MPIEMTDENKDDLVELIATLADSEDDPKAFFIALVREAHLTKRAKQDLKGIWSGNARRDARKLIDWVLARDENPADPGYTILGSFLKVLLKDLGPDRSGREIAALIIAYRLYDSSLLDDLRVHYQVPQRASKIAGGMSYVGLATSEPGPTGEIELGPHIEMREPIDEVELQGLFQSEPEPFDVGFLQRGLARAASVCKVEVQNMKRVGTGVLIKPDLLLTNYHVLDFTGKEDIEENARNTMLRFGFITTEGGQAASGQTFKLAGDPILSRSPAWNKDPADRLDYVLLRVESSIKGAEGIEVAEWETQVPGKKSPLHIIQHPHGDAMKLALSSNGVSGVYIDTGLIQYVTKTAGGSSGAPCFNDEWKLVALHHAERSTTFGAIREGIIFDSIHQRIERHLEGDQ